MPSDSVSLTFWIGFTAAILVLLVLDLALLRRKTHVIRPREALITYGFWVALAAAFNVWVVLRFGAQKGLEFTTGYLIENALSVDNIFVFIVIFDYFAVPPKYQHRVLFWGILGAIIMRITFILAGASLLHAFHWTIYLMGAFLIFTGFKLLSHKSVELHPERNPMIRLFRRLVPTVPEYRGASFFVRHNGRLHATLLFIVLVAIEATDVAFAVDSIPAIFAITRDPFIVYTSNIFAILGLRSLFFLLSGVMGQFQYLPTGLAIVLMFVGVKMIVSEFYKIPIALSLGIVASVLAGSIVASRIWPKPEEAHAPRREDPDAEEAAAEEKIGSGH
jgi:tellurite resistance protein TerC